ncbi:MAG: mCpol domain-containing protein [Leptolyngbya sp. SIO4C1]|nr:mCpol domain-containing protein [Leptolyngbya sp. SIO4C1]
MAFYISIDGDDTGSKIAISYFENNEKKLSQVIQDLHHILSRIQEYLINMGFEIIFCAADGIACKGKHLNVDEFAKYLKVVGDPGYTFSAGIGSDLQSSYFALKYAKSAGKNISVICKEKIIFQIV